MVDYPGNSVDRSCKYRSGAGERPWPWRQRFFRLAPQSYWVLGRVILFRRLLRGRGFFGRTESSWLLLGPRRSRILSGLIKDTPGELPSLVLICLDTESRILPSSKRYQQKVWSCQGSFGGIFWTSARSLARLCCNIVCVGAIAGWPTHAKTKLQMKFCLALWRRRFWSDLHTASKIDSSPYADYCSKSPGIGPWKVVCKVLGLPLFGLVPEPLSKPSWIAWKAYNPRIER